MTTRDPEQIRVEIAETRDEITRSLAALRSRVVEATDLRTYVRRRPLAFVAGAFALGLFLGTR